MPFVPFLVSFLGFSPLFVWFGSPYGVDKVAAGSVAADVLLFHISAISLKCTVVARSRSL